MHSGKIKVEGGDRLALGNPDYRSTSLGVYKLYNAKTSTHQEFLTFQC